MPISSTSLSQLCKACPQAALPSTTSVVKLWGIIGMLGLAWWRIFIHDNEVIMLWLDNDMVPWQGVCVILIASLALWKRHPLLVNPIGRTNPLWAVVGAFLLFWLWKAHFGAYTKHYLFLVSSGILIYGLGGKLWLRVVLPSVLIMFYFVALPPSMYIKLVESLKEYAVYVLFEFSKVFLSSDYIRVGMGVYQRDPILPYRFASGVIVVDMCSGYRSLFGLSILSLLFGASIRISLSKKIFLYVSSACLAIGGNLLRVVISGVQHHYNIESFQGMGHSILGIVLMLLELIFLWLACGQICRPYNDTLGATSANQ